MESDAGASGGAAILGRRTAQADDVARGGSEVDDDGTIDLSSRCDRGFPPPRLAKLTGAPNLTPRSAIELVMDKDKNKDSPLVRRSGGEGVAAFVEAAK